MPNENNPLTQAPDTQPGATEVAAETAPAGLPDVNSLPIEQCFEELESIVKTLEDEASSLDESLKLFERGMKLSARCGRELTRVERRIQVIMDNARGEMQLKDFTSAEDDSN